MTRAALAIDNRTARHLWLDRQGLSATPTGPLDVMGIVTRLGFVQLDTIQVVSRAHHHILWSRNQHYREPMLDRLLRPHRALFEHFTHDASVLPMEMLPMWQRQFRRKRAQLDRSGWLKHLPERAAREAIKARIRDEGPLSTHAFDTKVEGDRRMWARPPHKVALDYMWYGGELATCHRDGFTKVYDLAERIFPAHLREAEVSEDAQVDWLCRAALDRLGFATPGDLQRFWEAVDNTEARAWSARADTVPVEVETAEGTHVTALAPPDIEARLATLAPPSSRLRILNPFDPVIRDRARLSRLFGFDYRVEMFVPAAKRIWGYYVYPLLEGDRMVGRLEVRGDRATGALIVTKLWVEPGVAWTKPRQARLEAELDRLRRFVGLDRTTWDTQAPRP